LLAGGDEPAGNKRDALQMLPIDLLRPGKYQPRTHMDEASLAELADSIRVQGVMQPILVRPVDGNRYEIIAGERRWRAARRANLREVPALIKIVPDQAALALALIENIQREDLNPLEEALGLERLIREFGLTHEAAATAVGRSRSAVTNLLRLTQLAKPVQDYLMTGGLEMGHARALLALPKTQQSGAAARVVNGKLSVRETERLVHTLQAPPAASSRMAPPANADTARLETDIAEALGAKVKLQAGKGGAGKLVISYATLEQLDGIIARFK
jgi:ParB family chromosome partitioning protein